MTAKTLLAAGVVALGTLVSAIPANATSLSIQIGSGWVGQDVHYRGGQYGRHDRWSALSPQQVRRVLRQRGFDHIRFIDRQGSVYVARAQDWRGRAVRVVVSARSGAILDVDRIHRGGHYRRG